MKSNTDSTAKKITALTLIWLSFFTPGSIFAQTTTTNPSYSPPPLQYTIPATYGGFKADCTGTKYNCVDVQICLKPSGNCSTAETVTQRLVFDNVNTAVPPYYSSTTTSVPAGICAWVATSASPTGLINCQTVNSLDTPTGGCTTANIGATATVSSCISMYCNGVQAASPNPAVCAASQTLTKTYTCQCGQGNTTTTAATTTTSTTTTTVATTTTAATTTSSSSTSTSSTIATGGGTSSGCPVRQNCTGQNSY